MARSSVSRPSRSRRAGAVVAVALIAGVLTAVASPASAAPIVRPSVVTENDANHDGVFSSSETLPPSAKFPYDVTYRLTIYSGSGFGPPNAVFILRSITDDRTADVGSCAALVGTSVSLDVTRTCTYTVSLTAPGPEPLVNTATIVWNGRGNDFAASSSTVDFGKSKGKCNSGNGNGSDPIQFTDPTAHCYGGDPGNSYNAGNKGGDEIPTSGGVPNPGGNNVP